MKRFLALLGAIGLPLASFAQNLAVEAHTLENGMKVLIHEDHDIPNVALYLFFKVGSRNERPGITGVSHFFEHMMFNGAKKYGPKQFDIVMEKNGGSNNAYTTPDLTVYTDWFPSNALELMFDMEADRMQNLALDPKIVESERGVVYSERRLRVDNDNFGMLFEQLKATSFLAHPYQWPVVGWASDIEAWTIDDLKAHYRMGYAPNNCVMVVAGAVKPDQVMALAKKYFAPIPRQDPPPAVRTKEPEQIGERRLVIRKQAEAPIVVASYHVTESKHPDYPALQLLDTILSSGRSSRLYRRLVDRDQLAIAAGSDFSDALDPGDFILYAMVRPGGDPAKVEGVLLEEVAKIAKEGPAQVELEKARNQRVAELFRQFRTISGKANLIGWTDIYRGDWTKVNTLAADFEKVTAADVQRVAAKYLEPGKRTVATLIPEAEADKKGEGK